MFEEKLIDRFRQKALLAAPRMNFDPALVNESVSVILNTFGEEWVTDKADERPRGLPLPLNKHPIGGMFHTGGDFQIAEVLELSSYLKQISESAAFPTIVAGLKAQFRSTRLQLAFAYRIGALADGVPELEPPVAGGRLSDIAFDLDGQSYLAECYAPGTRSRDLDEVQWLTSKVIASIEDRTGTFSVAIQLHCIPTAAERKQLQGTVKKLVGEVDGIRWAGVGFPPSRLAVTDVATVSVAQTLVSEPGQPAILVTHPDFPRLGDPHQFTAVKLVPASKVKALASDTIGEPYHDHVAVWLPDDHEGLPEHVDEQVLELVPKLKTKLAQTKALGCHRIVIVDTWTAGSRFSLSQSSIDQLRHDLFENHSDVAGVLMVTRRYSESLARYRYEMRPFLNEAVGGAPLRRLHDAEADLLIPATFPEPHHVP